MNEIFHSRKVSFFMQRNSFLVGVKDALPIFLGYLPLGLTLGITAKTIGFFFADMFAMSTVVFAGSSQFIGVDMIGKGVAFSTIIATTFFVNFRHFMLSGALAPYFQGEKTLKLIFVGAFITDESFAVCINNVKSDPVRYNTTYLLGVEITAYLSWLFSSCLGLTIGSFIPSYDSLGLDFALSAMFIGLIAAMVKSKTHLVVCLLSGIISLVLLTMGIKNFNVIIASILVSCAAVGVQYAGSR
jgi:4-azaleucine resistance transporter AzlC